MRFFYGFLMMKGKLVTLNFKPFKKNYALNGQLAMVLLIVKFKTEETTVACQYEIANFSHSFIRKKNDW